MRNQKQDPISLRNKKQNTHTKKKGKPRNEERELMVDEFVSGFDLLGCCSLTATLA